MEQVCILGAGVRAQVVVDLIDWQFPGQIKIAGYYDDRMPAGEAGPGDHPVLGTIPDAIAQLPGSDFMAFIALGTRFSARGWDVYRQLNSLGVRFLNLIPRAAHISPTSSIGKNALIMPGVFVGCDVQIGDMFCAHGGAIIEHHTKIGDNVVLGPGVSIASKTRIESHTFLGAGSSVIPEVSIGEGSFIGAGSGIVDDIPAHVVAYGSPARPVRPITSKDEVPTEAQLEDIAKKKTQI